MRKSLGGLAATEQKVQQIGFFPDLPLADPQIRALVLYHVTNQYPTRFCEGVNTVGAKGVRWLGTRCPRQTNITEKKYFNFINIAQGTDAKSKGRHHTYWISFLFFFWGSTRRRVSLITATFTSSSTGLGTFSNTPGESFTLQRDTIIQYGMKDYSTFAQTSCVSYMFWIHNDRLQNTSWRIHKCLNISVW